MKEVSGIQLIATCMCMLLGCVAVYSSDWNIPADGTTAAIEMFNSPSPIVSVKDNLWCISDSLRPRHIVNVRFESKGDSSLHAIMPGLRYEYVVKSDSVLIKSKDSHFVNSQFTTPRIERLSLSKLPTGSNRYTSITKAFNSQDIYCTGLQNIEYVGKGNLILPNQDTIYETTVVKFLREESNHYITDYDKSYDIRSCYNILAWIKDEYPLPLAYYEVRTDSVIGKDHCVLYSLWTCPPSFQPLDDVDNRSKSTQSKKQSQNGRIDLIDNENITITISDGLLNLSSKGNLEGTIDIRLCDSLGRVCLSRNKIDISLGPPCRIDISQLPHGEYVVYVTRNEDVLKSQKILK